MTTPLNFGQYLAGSLADWLSNNAPMPAAPAGLKLALSSADPSPDGSTIAEPGGSYARQTATLSGITYISEGLGLGVDYAAPIVFAGVASFTWAYASLWDSAGTNQLLYGQLPDYETRSGTINAAGIYTPALILSASLSSYFSNLIFGWLRGTNFPANPTVYAGLLSSAPLHDGSPVSELAFPGYSRKAVSWGTKSVDGTTGTTISNNAAFGPFLATTATQTVATHMALFDGPGSTANLLAAFPFTAPYTLNNGAAIYMPSGSLAVNFR